MKKIAIVIGTRPEGIKLAPIINYLKTNSTSPFIPIVITTGQHTDLLTDVLSFFNITPDHQLTITRNTSLLSELQAKCTQELETLFQRIKPDIVMVQGDTLSTFAGALAAFYQKIPIAYVEAGLRSYNKLEPFPEEANRLLITQLASWHFTPTTAATHALKKEGIINNVFEVGNTVIDALHFGIKKGKHKELQPNNKKQLLVTIHRRENWGNNIQEILSAVKTLSRKFKEELSIVWVKHANKTLSRQIEQALSNENNVKLKDPLSYPELIDEMASSYLILTDSGGIQEEAPSLNIPVLVAREVTERSEGIDAGCAKLVGTSSSKIIEEVTRLIQNNKAYETMATSVNPYGDGTSSQKIIDILEKTTN